MKEIKIKTTYFEFIAKIEFGKRYDYIKQIEIKKENYIIKLSDIEILEFKVLLDTFLRGALIEKKTKKYELLFFKKQEKTETKIKIQNIILSVFEVSLIREILFKLEKKYDLFEIN